MSRSAAQLRQDALAIWNAGLHEVQPAPMLQRAVSAFPDDWHNHLARANRILVVGAGKAGGPMSTALEQALAVHQQKIVGVVNVPEGTTDQPCRIKLHPARAAGSNHPTQAGVEGAEVMLQLVQSAAPDDVAICLLSGGGSALLPAPASGITLAEKQSITIQLHAAGATINEMNCVRKHLSRIKGGRLAQAFRGKLLVSLILSDVVGDPLDVIASGPTVPDPTTLQDAIQILQKYHIYELLSDAVKQHLTDPKSESPKHLPDHIHHVMIGSNSMALSRCEWTAQELGYSVLNLGPMVEGESAPVAVALAGIVRAIQANLGPIRKPACLLLGGETTVTLGPGAGKGGRNQEFVLAALHKLEGDSMPGVGILSAGTDGEDGPTDAAGAVATSETLIRAKELKMDLGYHLQKHDAYNFFAAAGGLIKTGLTGTNVMDLRLLIVT